MPVMTIREAVSQALWEEMERDPNVIILGEEVGVWGGTYAVTKGFYDHFGAEHIRSTAVTVIDLSEVRARGTSHALDTATATVTKPGLDGFEVLRRKYFSLRDNPAGLATSLAPGLDPMARRIRESSGCSRRGRCTSPAA